MVLTPTDDDLAEAERERHREDLRLLYVALTRARHAVWVGAPCVAVGNGKTCQWAKSALGHLLPASNPEDGATCVQAVRSFAAAAASMPGGAAILVESALEALGEARLIVAGVGAATRSSTAGVELGEPLEYHGDFNRHWTLLSYSGLVKGATARAHESRLRTPREDEPDEPGDAPPVGETAVPPPPDRVEEPLRALIFDSWFDSYRGVIILMRVVDGRIRLGQSRPHHQR